ncbi:ABC transporter ATP-binding protein [Candidatus Marinamargulisbacteria bacterium SCGC AG-414-C22]|nr:ABC transporter ATP-binding protein [Candidatus Marinamargulisbacteria bacterium SCGC AG-414-C22]
MDLLTVKDLNLSFDTPDGCVQAVNDLSFTVKQGSIFGIAGESGSGKTQSMMSVMGLLEANARVSGSILFKDTDLLQLTNHDMNQYRSRHMSMVFQDPMTSLNPFLTIGSQLTEVLIYHKKYSKQAAITRSLEMLSRVHLPDPETLLKRYPHELSGGMKQRVAIAMALLCEPDLLIADEATTALDVIIQAEILDLLKELKQTIDMTIIMITHDLAVISELCDDILVMCNGELMEEGVAQTVLQQPQHPYTQALLKAVPRIDVDDQILIPFDKNTIKQTKKPIKKTPKQIMTSPPEELPIPLAVTDLHVHFQINKGFFQKPTIVNAVNGVSFSVKESQTLGIVGESGCGKSTLARAIIGLLSPTAGDVLYHNQSIQSLHESLAFQKDIQIIFQDPLASLNPRMTIGDCIAEPLTRFEPHLTRNQREEKVLQLMNEVGLVPEQLNRYPHEFSGGQCQRIGIARALISQPKILVCDEPVSALDVSIQAQIIHLLIDLKEKFKLTILFISHDLSVVKHISDDVVVMYGGEIMEVGPTTAIFNTPQHDYTKRLLAAVPKISF